ncbi:unnamed protein product, partial [Rotaria socialis]
MQTPYRNNNNNKQYSHEPQMLSPSPTRENFDENKQILNDSKQSIDMELNMNCMEEQLTEAQLVHCPVK